MAGDIDGAAKSITAAGGTVVARPMEIPGNGRMSVVADPAGALFVVIGPTV